MRGSQAWKNLKLNMSEKVADGESDNEKRVTRKHENRCSLFLKKDRYKSQD